MDRKRFSQCAGILALIAFSFYGAFLATDGVLQNEVAQAPLRLPVSTDGRRMPVRPLAEVAVLPTGLIEAAIPPSPKRHNAEPARTAPDSSAIKITPKQPAAKPPTKPLALKVAPAQPSPRPTMIEAAREAPISRPPTLVVPRSSTPKMPTPKMPAEPSVADGRAAPFIIRGITSSLPRSVAPTGVADNLVTRRRTEFVTRTIKPAVPPTLPLAVSAEPEASKTSDVAVPNKLRKRVNAADQRTADKPVVATPAVQTAKAAIDKPERRNPVRKNFAARQPVVKTKEKLAAKPQVGKKAADRPARDKLAPAPVELAPVPVATKAAPARDKVADTSTDGGSPQSDVGKQAADDLATQDDVASDVATRAKPVDDTTADTRQMMPLAKAPGGHPDSEPNFTTLPWNQPTHRNPELVAAIKRANGHVLHGYELASRGALYAGRAECIAAIRIIAQAYDAQDGTRRYTKAAAAGLTALKEADDFVRQSEALRDVEISRTIVTHRTPILKDSDTSDLTPVAAARCYYSYAQEQLSASVGQELCGSMALYAMGKVAVVDTRKGGPSAKSINQAMTLYRAALIANPKNFRAANELGVLLAENGQFELARDLLIRSVSVSPQFTTWKNLAALHTRTGEPRLAERAKRESLALQRAGRDTSPAPAVKWVDPSAFASTTSASDAMPVAGALPKQPLPAAEPKPDTKKSPVNVAKKSIADWLKVRRR